MDLLISGASRGIGRALAVLAAGEGHRVLALGRSEEKLQRLAQEVEGIHPLTFDFADPPEMDRVRELLKGKGFEKLDGVVLAAGHLEKASSGEQDKGVWERTLSVNLIGPALFLQAVHPLLKEGEGAHVVLIGSMAGYPGSQKFPPLGVYGASKAALAALGESLAEQWKADGIRVNTLALGAVDTEMFREAFPDGEAPVGPERMARFLLRFLEEGEVMSGAHVPVSISTP